MECLGFQQIQQLTPELLGLKYTLLPGQCDFTADHSLCQTYNNVYSFWKDFWTKVLKDNGSKEVLNCDAFNRPLVTTLLHNDSEIAGLHMYSAFDLRQHSHLEHSYFAQSYPASFLERLEKAGHQSVLTMEFLTVSPQWRKSRLGFSLAEVLMSLGVKIFQSLSMDCMITLARGDLKVPQLLKKINFQSSDPVLERHNTPCEVMSLDLANSAGHPDTLIANLVEHFWQKKSDHTKLSTKMSADLSANLQTRSYFESTI